MNTGKMTARDQILAMVPEWPHGGMTADEVNKRLEPPLSEDAVRRALKRLFDEGEFERWWHPTSRRWSYRPKPVVVKG